MDRSFAHLPVGQPIPASPHAVSCSLPTMADVCGYEEGNTDVLRHVTSGYPRFVVHPLVKELAAHILSVDPNLRGRTLWLTSSRQMASRLIAYLPAEAEAALVDREGVYGVAHVPLPKVADRTKHFLQHVGGFLSSREAEDHLVSLGLRPAIHAEDVFAGEAIADIRQRLAGVMTGARETDVVVTNCGMNAVYATFRAISEIQAQRGRTAWLQIGWLYLDTIALLQQFTPGPSDYLYVNDVFDAAGLEALFAEHGSRLAGVMTEAPTNPLVQTADLPALAALCRRHGARLVVDPSIASVWNVDVLPYADVVACSLTKYTASEGDLTAGLVAVNPVGTDAETIRAGVTAAMEPLYVRDAARLARELAATPGVLARIHASTPRVVTFLESHPAVKNVFWALHAAGAANYRRLARTPDAVGGMVTLTLRQPGHLARVYNRLRLPKGPSFGMTTTLVCPFMYLAHYDMVTTETGRARLLADGLDPNLLRLCVGTEPVEDIIDALAEALAS
jgi:cystathionine gamma-synthase